MTRVTCLPARAPARRSLYDASGTSPLPDAVGPVARSTRSHTRSIRATTALSTLVLPAQIGAAPPSPVPFKLTTCCRSSASAVRGRANSARCASVPCVPRKRTKSARAPAVGSVGALASKGAFEAVSGAGGEASVASALSRTRCARDSPATSGSRSSAGSPAPSGSCPTRPRRRASKCDRRAGSKVVSRRAGEAVVRCRKRAARFASAIGFRSAGGMSGTRAVASCGTVG